MIRRSSTAFVLLYILLFTLVDPPAPQDSMPQSLPATEPSTVGIVSSPNLLTLNAPMLKAIAANGGEITLRYGIDYIAILFDRADIGNPALNLSGDTAFIDKVKESNDNGINITPDRRRATLTNGQTVYYGVKLTDGAAQRLRGVTFILVTVPKSGRPDIINNHFDIKYVDSSGDQPGDVTLDNTINKAYQVITPAGKKIFYFSFTAVVKTGGIETTITTVFFAGPKVVAVVPQYVVCCWEQIDTPLPAVPSSIPYNIWSGERKIEWCLVDTFQCALKREISANTANVPCMNAEAVGKKLTILGAGFDLLPDLLTQSGKTLEQAIHVTDGVGSVAAVTHAQIKSASEIEATIDVTACRPGKKCVTIDCATGYGNVTFLRAINDMNSVSPGSYAFGAVAVQGTCDKMLMTMTTSGTNVRFDASCLNIFNVGCIQSLSETQVSFNTTGSGTNIASYIMKGTSTPGTQMLSEYLGEPVVANLVTAVKPVQNNEKKPVCTISIIPFEHKKRPISDFVKQCTGVSECGGTTTGFRGARDFVEIVFRLQPTNQDVQEKCRVFMTINAIDPPFILRESERKEELIPRFLSQEKKAIAAMKDFKCDSSIKYVATWELLLPRNGELKDVTVNWYYRRFMRKFRMRLDLSCDGKIVSSDQVDIEVFNSALIGFWYRKLVESIKRSALGEDDSFYPMAHASYYKSKDLTSLVEEDFVRQTINYGDPCWMLKVVKFLEFRTVMGYLVAAGGPQRQRAAQQRYGLTNEEVSQLRLKEWYAFEISRRIHNGIIIDFCINNAIMAGVLLEDVRHETDRHSGGTPSATTARHGSCRGRILAQRDGAAHWV